MRIDKGTMGKTPVEKVQAMLSALPRIEPPGDFEVRVRSRIAAERVPPRAGGPLLWAKLAVPALAAVALAAVFFGGLSRENAPERAQEAVPAVETQPLNEPSDDPTEQMATQLPQEDEIKENEVAETATPTVASRNSRRERPSRVPAGRRAAVAAPENTEEGGAFEEAGRAGSRILPRGLESIDEPRPDAAVPPAQTAVKVADLLSVLGIDAERSSTGWKARSIREGSVAQKSGVQPGDVIEAIDGKDLSKVTEVKGRISGSYLQVNRAGRSIRLNILPK